MFRKYLAGAVLDREGLRNVVLQSKSLSHYMIFSVYDREGLRDFNLCRRVEKCFERGCRKLPCGSRTELGKFTGPGPTKKRF